MDRIYVEQIKRGRELVKEYTQVDIPVERSLDFVAIGSLILIGGVSPQAIGEIMFTCYQMGKEDAREELLK